MKLLQIAMVSILKSLTGCAQVPKNLWSCQLQLGEICLKCENHIQSLLKFITEV